MAVLKSYRERRDGAGIRSLGWGPARLPDEPCRGKVFDGHAYGFEDDAATDGCGDGAGENFADLGLNLRTREAHVARFALGAGAGLGDYITGKHGLVVQFAQA